MNSGDLTAPLVITLLLYSFSGMMIITENLLIIVLFATLSSISLYWLIKRIDYAFEIQSEVKDEL